MVKTVQLLDALNEGILRVEIPAQPRKKPRQARSVALVAALKQTGRQIMASEGRGMLTAQRLTDDSGVAISSIYEYFPTMESLVVAIYEDYRLQISEDLQAGIRALPTSATLFDGILVLLRIGLEGLYTRTLFDPAFSVRFTHYDELVRLQLVSAHQEWNTSGIALLMARFDSEIVVKDREKTELLVFQTLQALPRAMLLANPKYLIDEDTPLLLARMLHGLLTHASE